MNRRRVAASLAGSVLAAALLSSALLSAGTPEGFDLVQSLVVAAFFGLPLAVASAVLAHRLSRHASDGDVAARFVAVATAGLPPARREWGAALRAELAAIDDARARRRFAISCGATVLRASITGKSFGAAFAAGGVVAILTLAASRISLAGGRSGIMIATVYLSAVVVFATGLFGGASRSILLVGSGRRLPGGGCGSRRHGSRGHDRGGALAIGSRRVRDGR